MKEYILDGNKFSTIEEFHSEIDRLMTKDLEWKTGHNWSAFNDLLRGGFGAHELGEEIVIKWINYEKSKEYLGPANVLTIIEIILDFRDSGHNCKLELY